MERVFRAVLSGASDLARVLKAVPADASTTMTRDELVRSVPHWLYAGDTPLHLAAAALAVSAARLLLQSGADPNASNRRGATPMHYACDPRPASGGGWNPRAQTALIALLIGHGGDVDRPDRGGATPLHRAVRARSVAAVQALVAAGANRTARLKKSGATPLGLTRTSTGAGGTAHSDPSRRAIIAL